MNELTYEQQLGETHSSYCFPSLMDICFSPEECQLLMNTVDSAATEGTLGSMHELRSATNIRRSKITRLDPNNYHWLMQRMADICSAANTRYNFDLSNAIIEPAQIAMYDETDRGCYEWHTDIGPTALTRKLSISVPLNSAENFEGGELEFNMGRPKAEQQIAGAPIVFPSYILHRVTPVTRGRRYSLVCWIHGPKWR